MACSSRCLEPGTHASLGACLRDKGVKVAYSNSAGGFDSTAQKAWDRNLDAYQDARRQGIQPASTSRVQVDAAVEASNQMGQAYEA